MCEKEAVDPGNSRRPSGWIRGRANDDATGSKTVLRR